MPCPIQSNTGKFVLKRAKLGIVTMLSWLKKTREGHGWKTYWLHRIGTITAVGLLIYWWRAAKHVIDSLNAGLEAWVKSGSFFLGWIEGLWSAAEFALAQPIYLVQVAVCCAIVYFTQSQHGLCDRHGQGYSKVKFTRTDKDNAGHAFSSSQMRPEEDGSVLSLRVVLLGFVG